MRLLRSLHAWSGLVLAVLAVVLGLSGAVLVFEADYLRAKFPAARAAAPLDAASLARVAEAAGQTFPQQIRSIVLARPELGLHQVYLTDGGGAYLDGDGAIVDRWSKSERFEIWLFELHEDLLAGETGHVVAGIAGLAFMLMAITGLILWTPVRRSFGGHVWPSSSARRHLLAQHRDVGVLTALPILLFSVTGVAMVFSAPVRTALTWILPGGPSSDLPAPVLPPLPHEREVDWTRVLTAAQQRFPEAALRVVAWPGANGGPVSVRLQQPAEWHPNGRTRVLAAAATGEILYAHDASRDTLPARAYNALYPLHAARIGGRAYDLLSLLSGLALTLLGSFGAWSYAKRLHSRSQDRRAQAAASAIEAATSQTGTGRPGGTRG